MSSTCNGAAVTGSRRFDANLSAAPFNLDDAAAACMEITISGGADLVRAGRLDHPDAVED